MQMFSRMVSFITHAVCGTYATLPPTCTHRLLSRSSRLVHQHDYTLYDPYCLVLR